MDLFSFLSSTTTSFFSALERLLLFTSELSLLLHQSSLERVRADTSHWFLVAQCSLRKSALPALGCSEHVEAHGLVTETSELLI